MPRLLTRTIALIAFLVALPTVVAAQVAIPDIPCLDSVRINLDTLSRQEPPPPRELLSYQARSRVRLDQIATARCVTYTAGPNPPPTPRTLAGAPSSLTFAALSGGSSPTLATVSLTNSGGTAAINNLGSSVSYTSGTPGWLALSLTSTATPATLTVTPTTNSLGSGTYTATITTVGDSAGTLSTPVTLTVSSGPIIVSTPNSVSWTITEGDASPAAATTTITNGGGGSISGLSTGSITYGASQPTGWASAGLSGVSGTGGTLTLTPTVTGLTAGIYTFTVEVTASGATSATVAGTLTVNPIVTPPPPPPPPPSGSIAELPRFTPAERSPLASSGCTTTISSGLQAAINAATMGQVICLSSGVTFSTSGSFTFPARGDTGWVEIRGLVPQTGAQAPGTRIRPSTSGLLPKITNTAATGNLPIITFAGGARGWAFTLVEIMTNQAITVGPNSIVTVPDAAVAADTVHRLNFDRTYIHATPTQSVVRCMILNGRWITVIDSWLDDCHIKGFDSQAIITWGSAGPLLIRNNYLAGAGENVMFGGARPIRTGEGTRDVTMDHNHLETPIAWKGLWTKKNLFETKHVSRLLMEYNVLEGSWRDGQTGTCFTLKTANNGNYSWATVNDITIRYNLCVKVGEGVVFNGWSPIPAKIDSLTRRMLYQQNYHDSVYVLPLYDGASRQTQIVNNISDLQIIGNTWNTVGTLANPPLQSMMLLNDGSAISATRLVWKNNTTWFGKYGITGCTVPGPRGLGCLPGAIFQQSAVYHSKQLVNYPPGLTAFPDFNQALAHSGSITRAQIDALVAGVRVAR